MLEAIFWSFLSFCHLIILKKPYLCHKVILAVICWHFILYDKIKFGYLKLASVCWARNLHMYRQIANFLCPTENFFDQLARMETLRMSLAELPGTVVATTGTSRTAKLPVKSESDWKTWRQHFSEVSKTSWTVSKTFPNVKRCVLHKKTSATSTNTKEISHQT